MFLPSSTAYMVAMDSLAFDKMKSSRRKQSKPIRVSYTADGEIRETGLAPTEELKDIREEEFPRMNGNSYPEQQNISESSLSVVEADKSKIEEKRRMTTPPNMDAIKDSFPTKYHQLGRELFERNVYTDEEGNEKPLTEKRKSPYLDEEDIDRISKEEGRKLDGSARIFHQDAYCEICDREFCNKYFLKTHKANKHGIFENELSPLSAVSMPASLPTNVPPSMSPVTSHPMERDSPAQAPPTPTAPKSSTPSSFKIMDFIQNLPASEPKRPKPSDTPNSTKMEMDISSSSNNNKVSKDMEDFCELCQKHFCNKYYLKKHKSDVHGITPPDASSVHKRGRPKDLQAQLDAITSSAVASASAAVPPLIPHSMANMAGLPNMPGVMVLNPFVAGMPPMLIPTGSLMPGGQLPGPPGLGQPPLSLSATSPNISPAITSSASPSAMPPAESRGMGVMDAEAYCDLCKKEFCNKYFLKIHKANKHGMYLDEFPFGPPPLPNLPFKPGMSEGISMTAASPLTTISGEKEKDVPKMDSSPKAGTSLVTSSIGSENGATVCNLCSQEFSNRYSYKIHRIQVHGLLNEGIGLENALNEELMKNSFRERERENASREKEDPFSKMSPASKSSDEMTKDKKVVPENGRSTMFGNMVAAKLADRVTCDICKKELCNKYFLRVHKFKVHGIECHEKPELTFKGAAAKMQLTGDFETIKKGMSKKIDSPHISHPFKSEPKDLSLHSPQLPSTLPLPALPKPNDIPSDLSSNSSIEKPSNEELVKMGIDPEAYCEICKKEFCSKYFLRTHKLNIHGIKSEATPDKLDKFSMMMYSNSFVMNNSGLNAGIPGFMPPSIMNGRDNLPPDSRRMESPISMGGMGNNNNNLESSMNYNSMSNGGAKPLNLSMNGDKKPKGVYEKHSWRWKEPANSSRVSCEICNKELCNKYFLRTHKLNKHGILPSENSMSPGMNNSPVTSDIETSSNSSIPTDLCVREKNNVSPNGMKFGNMNPTFDDKLRPQKLPSFGKFPSEEEMMANQFYNLGEICYLCDRKFKSAKWLKAHILKDHAGMTAGLPPELKRSLNFDTETSGDQTVCRLCSQVFANELAMHLHMIQDHNAQVSLNTSEEKQPKKRYFTSKFTLKKKFSCSPKQKLYTCSLCSYKSKWLNNVISHELKQHKVVQKKCPVNGYLEECQNLKVSKVYRCNICSSSFSTPLMCHQHIRVEHIRKKNFKPKVSLPRKRKFCSMCSFSTLFPKQLRHHLARAHSNRTSLEGNGVHMEEEEEEHSRSYASQTGSPHLYPLSSVDDECQQQSFTLTECDNPESDFPSSIVKIPVRRRYSAPVTVTFLLTPMEQ